MAGKTLTKKKTDELFSTSSTIEKNTLLTKLSAKSKQKQLKKEEKEKSKRIRCCHFWLWPFILWTSYYVKLLKCHFR